MRLWSTSSSHRKLGPSVESRAPFERTPQSGACSAVSVNDFKMAIPRRYLIFALIKYNRRLFGDSCSRRRTLRHRPTVEPSRLKVVPVSTATHRTIRLSVKSASSRFLYNSRCPVVISKSCSAVYRLATLFWVNHQEVGRAIASDNLGHALRFLQTLRFWVN